MFFDKFVKNKNLISKETSRPELPRSLLAIPISKMMYALFFVILIIIIIIALYWAWSGCKDDQTKHHVGVISNAGSNIGVGLLFLIFIIILIALFAYRNSCGSSGMWGSSLDY